jgi:ferredoxin/flavodoxin---NADP+ reductase
MSAWVDATIVHRHMWAKGLMTLRLRAEIDPFEAGQWVNIGLDLEGEDVRRPYSLASAPGEQPEFYLTRIDEGVLTPKLFDSPIGSTIRVERKAQGFFTLKYVPDVPDLWLVATGTGLGPFISMLRTAEPWQRFERVIVVHGVRQAVELGYREELAEMARRHSGRLTVLATVSREPEAAGVLQGRVTTNFSTGEIERAAGIPVSAERSHLMLCGNPEMIGEMIDTLHSRGLRRHRVRVPGHYTTEKYW